MVVLLAVIQVAGKEAELPVSEPTEMWRDERTGTEVVALSRQVIVRFGADVTEEKVSEIARKFKLTELRRIPQLNAYLFRLPPDLKLQEAVVLLGQEPEALYAEANVLGELHRIPNDPLYTAGQNYQWSLKPPVAPYYGRINGENAWDLEVGSASVTVAVVDSGVDTAHPDLAPLWAPWGNDTVDIIGQTNTNPPCQPDNDPFDSSDVGHGTAVSGLVAAATDNGQGIAGTAWNVKILPLRVLGNCSGSNTAAIFYTSWGIVYAGSRSDVKVLSLSLGFSVPSDLMEDAVEYAYSQGKLVVASAGNDGNTVMQYPAAFPHVMAVTSVDENGQKSGFSTYGSWTDIAAPGGSNYTGALGITTTDMRGNFGYVSGDYFAGFQGTSASAPYVAGVAALIFSHFPDWTPDQVEQHLKATVTVPPGWNALWGSGVVNAYNAVRLLDTTPPALVVAESMAKDRVNLIFSEAMDPASAGNKANYSISGSGGLSVLAAFVGSDQKTVQLITAPQTGGVIYLVTVSQNVKDANGNPLPASSASREKNFVGLDQDKNLALQANGGKMTAWWTSSNEDFCVSDATSANANDGNIATAWTQTVGSNPNFATFLMARLADGYQIDRIVLRTDPGYAMEYQIEAGWALCGIVQNIVVPRGTYSGTQTFSLNPSVGAREVMVSFFSAQGNPGGTARVLELEVYGVKYVEKNPPQVSLTAPAEGEILRGTVTIQADANDDTAIARVEFYEGTTLLCVDDTLPYSCLWNTAVGGDGSKTLSARAWDLFGNSGNSTGINVTADNTPPDTIITLSPSSPSGSSSATFEFTSNEANTTFECALDSSGFAGCVSPKVYSGLADGNHQFRVRATDSAGNTDPTPAQYVWSIDTAPPETTIIGGPTNGSLTNSRSATFHFSSSKPNSTFECDLNAGGWFPCTSPTALSNLVDGNHQFRVRAKDAFGNTDPVPAEVTWQVDATPPLVTITAGPGDGSFVPFANVTFEFVSSENPTNTECFFDTGTWSPCTSPRPYSLLGEGPHQFAVRGTDLAGNLSNTEIRIFTVDTLAPVVSITAGPANFSVTNSPDLLMEFVANEPVTYECRLDAEPPQVCSSPFLRHGLAEGPHTLVITAMDRAGNAGSAERSWSIDLTPPGARIIAGPPALTNRTQARFEFTANGTTFECKLDDTQWEFCVSPKEYNLLTDGAHHFEVRGTDTAGNVDPVPATYDWTIDTVAPETVLGDTPPAITAARTARFTFSSDDPEATFLCAVDGTPETDCSSPYDTVVSEGAHTFSVRARDAAGNIDRTPATHQWSVVVGSLLVEPGPNPPVNFRVTSVSAPVPALQVRVTAGAPEGARLTQLVVTATGSGSDEVDIAEVMLVKDLDADGRMDTGEPLLASTTFARDNADATLVLTDQITAGNSTIYLILLTFRSPQTAGIAGIPARPPFRSGAFMILAMITVAGTAMRSPSGITKKGFTLALAISWVAGNFFFTACGGGGGGTSVIPAKTYTLSVTSGNSILATGLVSGAPLSVTGNFPITGATLTK
ncbi:MAG: S8 family serine peptidase [bacterium JZ-2024 1]